MFNRSIELPFKSSTYATLTALLNAKIFDIGVDVVLAVGNKLQASFDSQQYRDVKNLVSVFNWVQLNIMFS